MGGSRHYKGSLAYWRSAGLTFLSEPLGLPSREACHTSEHFSPELFLRKIRLLCSLVSEWLLRCPEGHLWDVLQDLLQVPCVTIPFSDTCVEVALQDPTLAKFPPCRLPTQRKTFLYLAMSVEFPERAVHRGSQASSGVLCATSLRSLSPLFSRVPMAGSACRVSELILSHLSLLWVT